MFKTLFILFKRRDRPLSSSIVLYRPHNLFMFKTMKDYVIIQYESSTVALRENSWFYKHLELRLGRKNQKSPKTGNIASHHLELRRGRGQPKASQRRWRRQS
jgi:hypothetical protein